MFREKYLIDLEWNYLLKWMGKDTLKIDFK